MCPDRKLQWFREHGRSNVQIQRIRERVIQRYDETYKPVPLVPPPTPTISAPETEPSLPLTVRFTLVIQFIRTDILIHSI